jgi:hypothetical protein
VIGVDASKTTADVRAVTARLDALAAELGKSYTLQLTFPGRAPQEQRLTWLVNGRSPHQPPRPILAMTGYAEAAIRDAVRVKFTESMLGGSTPSMLPVMVVAGYALKRVYVERFATSGGDITLAPLSPSWRERKRRLGLDPRIGRATGETADAMTKAQVIVKRSK